MSNHTAPSTSVTTALQEWIADQPSTADPGLVAGLVAQADVVGLATSTREAAEPFRFVDRATRLLLEQGFSTLALLENPRVTHLYDRYVTGGDVDVDQALAQAWGPWRTRAMRDALTWLREHNAGRETPVRVVGLGETQASPDDYDRIAELLGSIDEAAAAQVKERLDVIRVAHAGGEHVEHARGRHPGTPFVEIARSARGIAAALAPSTARDAALELLDIVVRFHAEAPGTSFHAGWEAQAAERLLDHARRTGDRIVFWEGGAHVLPGSGSGISAHLRAALGDGYATVHVTFAEGRIDRTEIPPARPDSIEAHLARPGGARTVHLRAEVPQDVAAQLAGPWPTRIISGVYDPARDGEHYLDLPSLTDAADVLVHLPAVTPIDVHEGP
ncbi:erythromycin esterase family protein [Isoptericola croceus]|uniref:erythromycin esterase family protein n=1 Tax=Isoptericola croceus TaxID=3031406 RepID=UPI0023F99EBB|nr:erythromycin esterase family protein [Isoptericola croceus]